jgi:hypothetical protein
MPGCYPPQPLPNSGNVHPLYPQAFGVSGLNSFDVQAEPIGGASEATTPARAISAWTDAAAEQRRRADWLAIGLPHSSGHLFARLPFGDAVQLAALVGTGQMSWTEINAALDAKIKMAVGGDQDHRSPAPHAAWEQGRRTAEEDIWARYHAKCDAVFADDTANTKSDDLLRDRERRLSHLRSERDRALAALNRRMGPSPQASSATAQVHLTATERNALRKLAASGFAGSAAMAEAVRDLAAPLAVCLAQFA